MLEPVALFAIAGAEQLATIAVKCLAVAGGFLAGYGVGGSAVWAVERWAFAPKSPSLVKKAVRWLAGVGVAVLVAMIVFGEGTGGGLFGGGQGECNGQGSAPSTEGTNKTEKGTPPTTQPPEKASAVKADVAKGPDKKPDDPLIRIIFLGGKAAEEKRFYRIDDDRDLKTLAEVKAAIQRKKLSTTQQVYLLCEFPTDPHQIPAKDGPTVTDVTNWAEGIGIKVIK